MQRLLSINIITAIVLSMCVILVNVRITRLRKPKSQCSVHKLSVPTYVINMEGEKGLERRERFEKQAKKQNLKLEYLRATDKEEIDFDKLLND